MENKNEPQISKDFENYVKECQKIKNIRLVFIGIDRYPNDFTNIPFCKEKWVHFNKNCSGTILLEAMKQDIGELEKSYKTPKDYFEKLKRDGVVFLNLSYSYLEAKPKITDPDHKQYLDSAMELNLPIIQKATKVVLCGKAVQRIINHKNFYDLKIDSDGSANLIKVSHPSPRNRGKSDWGQIGDSLC